MSSALKKTPTTIVLAPDVLAKSFFDPACRRVMEAWRDGAFHIVVSPQLLRFYARILRDLGVPEVQIRRWLQWFTASEKSLVLPTPASTKQSLVMVLLDTAQRSGTLEIATTSIPSPIEREDRSVAWLHVNDFAHRLDP